MAELNPLRISVDRLVSQYYESVETDDAEVRSFYDSLPFEDKPPLEECHIHLSGLACRDRVGHGIGGVHLRRPGMTHLYDPQAPEDTNILIFMGSAFATSLTPNKVMRHELAHYASSTSNERQPLTDDERLLRMQYALSYSRPAKAAKFIAGSGINFGLVYGFNEAFDAHFSTPLMLGMAVGVNGLAKFLKTKKEKQSEKDRTYELRKQILEHYKQRAEEQEAIEHEESSHSLVEAPVQDPRPPVLVRNIGAKNISVDFVHKKASLGYQLPLSNS
jgi:hypothetical protein